MKNSGYFALSVLTAAISQTVWANDMTTLDEVVVSGSRSATKLSETPQAIGVVDESQLKRDKPKTMGEAINRIPGVWWNDLGNEQHSMSIRQPISTNAMYQYLEDGIPIRPLGVFNHNSLNELNLAGAERVEVVKGAASSLYGSNAVGGAVNFLTARPSLIPTASVGYRDERTAGFNRIDASGSNTWGDWGLRASAYSSRRNANNWQNYSNGSKDSLTLRGDYALTADSLLHTTFSYNNLDSATPGSLGEQDYATRPGYSYNTFSWRKDKSMRLNLAWEGETTDGGLTTLTAFGRQNDHGQLPNYTIAACVKSATCPTGFKGTQNNNHVSSLGLDLKHQQEFEWLTSRLIAGLYLDMTSNPYTSNNLDIVRDPVTLRYLSYTPSTRNLVGVRNWNTDIRNTALFGQWELSPQEKLRVVLGGRSDSIAYNYRNYLTPGANYGAANESRTFSHFSPKIGATYLLEPAISLYTNLSEGFTPPETSQLYGAQNVPNLSPATYNNYEIGMRNALLDGALKLDTALYRLDGRNTIVSYTSAIGVSTSQNAGQTRSTGLEFNAHYQAAQTDAHLGVNLARHRFVSYVLSPTQNYSGYEMPAAPHTTIHAELGYRPVENSRIALTSIYQGAYWMDNANVARYPGHLLINFNGNYRLEGGLELWLQGRNLTNKLYADSATSTYKLGGGAYNPNTMNQYSVGAPRSMMVGVTYNFDGQ